MLVIISIALSVFRNFFYVCAASSALLSHSSPIGTCILKAFFNPPHNHDDDYAHSKPEQNIQHPAYFPMPVHIQHINRINIIILRHLVQHPRWATAPVPFPPRPTNRTASQWERIASPGIQAWHILYSAELYIKRMILFS